MRQPGSKQIKASNPTRTLPTVQPWNCAPWVMGTLIQGSAGGNLAQQKPRLLSSCQGLCDAPASPSCLQGMRSLNI